jgi:hypothetical protein
MANDSFTPATDIYFAPVIDQFSFNWLAAYSGVPETAITVNKYLLPRLKKGNSQA